MPSEPIPYRRGLYFAVNALSRKLGKLAEEAFASSGLAPSYAYLIMAVNEKPGIQPTELSELLQLSPSTVTRLVEKMEHRGYLERRSEGRATRVTPTETGKALNVTLERSWKELQKRYAGVLGERYRDVLTEMAEKAVDSLD